VAKTLGKFAGSFDFAQDDSCSDLVVLHDSHYAPRILETSGKLSIRLRMSSRVAFLDLVNSDCVGHVEAAGFRPAKRFQMRAATELFADVVSIVRT
jgi:hypothetical protein